MGDETLRLELWAVGDGTMLVFTATFDEIGKAPRDGAGWHSSLDLLGCDVSGRKAPGQRRIDGKRCGTSTSSASDPMRRPSIRPRTGNASIARRRSPRAEGQGLRAVETDGSPDSAAAGRQLRPMALAAAVTAG